MSPSRLLAAARRELAAPRFLCEMLVLGSLLTFAVIAWEHVIHVYVLSEPGTFGDNLRHVLRDTLLALPMGLAAVALSAWLARPLRLGDTMPCLLARAGLTALLLGLFLLPSVGLHDQIDTIADPGHALHDHAALAAASPLAGGEQAGQVPAALDGDIAKLEDDDSLSGLVIHGVHDALIAEVVALPLAAGGFLLLSISRLRRRRRPGPPQATARRPIGRRLALAGVAMVLGFAFASQGVGTAPLGKPAFAASDPCASSTTPSITYNVSAINVKMILNHFGDNDPGAFMYVLDQNITSVQNQQSAGTVTTGLREDPIQPLVLRGHLGDCIVINFTNRLTQGPLDSHGNPTPAPSTSIHVHGVSYQITSAGSAVGFNPDSFAAPGSSITYKIYLDPALGEGAKIFHSHGDSRQLTAHGLFGLIVAEPQGSTWLDPQTGNPLANGVVSNWEAIIQMPSGSSTPSFREFVIIYHEIGDESFLPNNSSGKQLPQNDPFTTAYRPCTRALNYRSECFFDRLTAMNNVFNAVDESQGYGSYTYGDPATPIPRSYLGEPTKTRLVHAGSEQAHVHHLHGGGDRWRRNPGSDSTNDISSGLNKTPQTGTSIRLDSQTISPMESYTLEHECGAGGCQQVAGDFLYHCHIAMHYIAGMWGFWRVFDTLQANLAVIPGRSAPPSAVDSSGLIGLTLNGKTIVDDPQFTSPSTQVPLSQVVQPLLPPKGKRIDREDGTVFDWTTTTNSSGQTVYLGEPEDSNCWANWCANSPVQGQEPSPGAGNRPPILFNPNLIRLAWPLLRPHLGQRPPFSARGHTGTPWLGTNTTNDTLCPSNAPVRTYNITAITLTIQETAAGDKDTNGQIFVLNEDKASVLANSGGPATPLAIRSNVGDCVKLTLTSQLVDNSENGNHSKVNMHTHFVQFDPQGSDGVITGRSYEQSVRPFPTENDTLTAAVSAGATQIAVSNTSRVRPGVFIAIGQGQPDIEINQVTGVTVTNTTTGAGTLTLANALISSHASGEPTGVEFVQYQWFSDVDSGTVFWHDHVDGIHSWGHGLFGAHIIEPPGSSYHDPKTGVEVRSGPIVDIYASNSSSTPGVGVPAGASYREYMFWLHNDLRGTGAPPGCEQPSINLKAEPFGERSPNNEVSNDQTGSVSNSQINFQRCPAIYSTNDPFIFSSVTHGDPFTPLLRAYVNDPVVIRTIGLVERVDALRITGHRFRPERFNANGELTDAGTTGISERFDYILDGGAGGPGGFPGDYLYYSTRNLGLEGGAWGIFRVHNTLQSDLKVLPGRTAPPSGSGFPSLTKTGGAPPQASSPGNPCPSAAPIRSYSVSVFNQKIPMDGNSDRNGLIYALSSDEASIQNGTLPTIPLAIRANQGDCVQITLKNDSKTNFSSSPIGPRSGLSLAKVRFDPQGSYGAAIGFDPDSSVAQGSSSTYAFYADQELGTSVFLNFASQASMEHGAFGALVVEPTGSSFTSVVDNSTLNSGLLANIRNSTGKFREFVALFQDSDPQIGRNVMPYNTDVQGGSSAVNYNAAPLDARLRVNSDPSLVFDSNVQGDPPTTLMRAYPGDPIRFRVAVPFSANVHIFHVEGHSWPWEPLMPGSQILSSRTLTSGETLDARLIGGAGGTENVAGDYLYLDHRSPFTRAGLWGIVRVYATTQSNLVTL